MGVAKLKLICTMLRGVAGALRRLCTTFYSSPSKAFYSAISSTMSSQPKAKLLSGAKIPNIGLGTWKSKQGQVKEAIRVALEVGYRHIDCAAVYGNEKEIGEALSEAFAANVVKREELFITSKLWNTKHRQEDVRPALMQTLSDLQLEYLDLYLIHWPIGFEPGTNPFPKNEDGSVRYDYVSYTETWAAMETLVEEGFIRHIGLSNFNSKQVDEVWAKSRIKPAALQCECHVYLNQKDLIGHVQQKGMVFEAYSPLGSPDRPWAKPGEPLLLEDPKIIEIGKKYGKSAAQVLIRYQVERGVAVLPKSVTPQRIKDNFVTDFTLSTADMEVLSSFERNWRCCVPKIQVNGEDVPRDSAHPHYPFNELF